MRIRNIAILAVAIAALVPVAASAQSSSINTFSPYTFYSLGELHTLGPANLRSMGGASIGYRNPWLRYNTGQTVTQGFINYNNPASLSSTPRQTFHFLFGLEGGNSYLKSKDQKSSYSTFNIRDVAFQMPLYSRLAVGVSLTPYSSVGYKSRIEETDPDVLAELYQGGAIGANYLYLGTGDVNQGKISIGWEPLRNLSIGVDMIYYFGEIDRSFTTNIITRSSDTSFSNAQVSQVENISRIMWNFGLQYNILYNNRRVLTFGATYTPGGNLNPDVAVETINATGTAQPIANGLAGNFKMPTKIAAGLFYHTWRLSAGVDYIYQGWGGSNDAAQTTGGDNTVSMQFRNTNTIRAGFEYTPERDDVRRIMRRFTYRAGVHYGDYYMKFNDTNISEMALTLGVGIPFKTAGNSYLDLGLELGQRGTTKLGLIKENYFKVSLGFRLFGGDWFRKRMYD